VVARATAPAVIARTRTAPRRDLAPKFTVPPLLV
jgi:hypothetical protein